MAVKQTELYTPNNGQQIPNLEDIKSAKARAEALAYFNSCLSKSKNARVPFERQWYMNLAFYFGKQNAQWRNTAIGNFAQLWEPAVPPWRVRLITNKCRRIVRKEISKVLKEKPRGYVLPASSDEKDTMAARAGEQILDHLQRELMLNRELRRAAFWLFIIGNGFLKSWYDENKVDSSEMKGTICLERVTPFHLFVPDLQEEEIENQPYVIHVIAKDPQWVKDTFKKEVAADIDSGSQGVLEQKFLSALGIANGGKNAVAVKEIWIKPCGKYPQGMTAIWAGEDVLASDESMIYKHGQYPFVKIDHIQTGRFYADSTLVDLIPLQREYNRTRSQLIESKNRMSKPQLISPRGSVEAKKITTEPGLLIEYTPGFQPPQPLPLQNLPSYVLQEIDRIQADINDLASQHEISQGQTPPGVTAATAISYLQEEDDSVLSGTIASMEEATEKLGKQLLSYVAQFWNAQRTVRVVGQNGAFESYVFSAADIKGNTDFRVEAGSAMPISRAAKQAFILELADRGLIPPDKVLRYLQMAETGRLWEETQLDARHAQRENVMMLAAQPGQPPVLVNSWDNHMIHIVEHDNERKKQEFELSSDESKQAFEAHVQMHKQVLSMSTGQIPGVPPDPMMAAQGGPQPPPGPGGMPAEQPTGPPPESPQPSMQ